MNQKYHREIENDDDDIPCAICGDEFATIECQSCGAPVCDDCSIDELCDDCFDAANLL